LFTLAFLVSVDLRILAPVLPSISASLGSTPGTVGLAMTSYALAYGTGQLVYGPLSDRLSRIAVVRAAGLGFSVCTVLSALAVTTWQFIGARLLAGAFAGAVIPLTLVFIGDTVELWGGVTYLGSFATTWYGLNQFSVGLLIALFGVGTMAGGLLMGLIRRRVSENVLAGIGGALMAAAFLVLIPRWPWVAFAGSMLALGLGFVGLHTTLQLRGTEISSTARGKAFSLFVFNLFAGISIGTAVLGRLVDAGRYEAVFALAGVGLIMIGLGTALPARQIVP
ncbi:MAG: MFS transporter, partial [candidate division NC10 bacterium]|nr:MFS transporter [candidate division NC10 bacterium]